MKNRIYLSITQIVITFLSFIFFVAPSDVIGQGTDLVYDPAKAEKVELNASEILPEGLKKLLKGDHYSVDEKVINVEGMNTFFIKSDFGDMTAESNYLLKKRIEEFPAIAELSKITRGKAFVDSQVDTVKASIDVTVDAVKHPIDTAKAIPGGVLRLFTDGYKDVKEGVKFVTGQSETEGLVGESIGTSSSIRGIAKDFLVDPYSRNPLLQKEMKRLSWVMAAGKKTEEYTRKITQKDAAEEENKLDVIWDLTLAKLIERNKELLKAMGIEEQHYEPLFLNQIYIPSEITRIVNALDAMKGTANLSLFIDAASQARTVDEAVFYFRTAELLSLYHQKKGEVKEILLIKLVPAALISNKTLIIASPIDYGLWTEYDQQIIDRFIQLAKSKSSGKPEILIEGLLSDRAKKELDSRDVNVVDLAFERLM